MYERNLRENIMMRLRTIQNTRARI